jgi:hypothetical protein
MSMSRVKSSWTGLYPMFKIKAVCSLEGFDTPSIIWWDDVSSDAALSEMEHQFRSCSGDLWTLSLIKGDSIWSGRWKS